MIPVLGRQGGDAPTPAPVPTSSNGDGTVVLESAKVAKFAAVFVTLFALTVLWTWFARRIRRRRLAQALLLDRQAAAAAAGVSEPGDPRQPPPEGYPQHYNGFYPAHPYPAHFQHLFMSPGGYPAVLPAMPPPLVPRYDPAKLKSVELKKEDAMHPCPICLEPLENERVSSGPCEHLFHTSCFQSWLAKDTLSSCPVCRARFVDDDSVDGARLRRVHTGAVAGSVSHEHTAVAQR